MSTTTFDLDAWLHAIDHRMVEVAGPCLRDHFFDTLEALADLREKDNDVLKLKLGMFRRILTEASKLV